MEVRFENVKYKETLKNLNINFKSGEITSLIGKNGSGKSTILNLLSCLDLPDSGEISIGRKKIDKNTRIINLKKYRNDIAYLKENYQDQLFNINIYEDLKYGLKKAINQEDLKSLIKSFGLIEEILKKSYLEISDSEKKRICLIKMFLSDSKILIFDNPDSGLDYKYIQNLVKLLKRIKRNDKVIILASHNSDFVLQVSDKIIAIDNKKNMFSGKKYEVMSNKKVLEKVNMNIPNIINFVDTVLKIKKIKLGYRDNINDLIKDIYRNAK